MDRTSDYFIPHTRMPKLKMDSPFPCLPLICPNILKYSLTSAFINLQTMQRLAFVLLMLTAFAFTSCKKDKRKEVTGTFEFTNSGQSNFTITDGLEDVEATITVIGSGGGGAGGVDYQGLMTDHSTGGGGGGGAGEKKTVTIGMEPGVEYIVVINPGGNGGFPGQDGNNGDGAGIMKNGTVVVETAGGKGGKSKPNNTQEGGAGGEGHPAGAKGGNGAVLSSGTASGGAGGAGGDNTGGYGRGGNGGTGTGANSGVRVNPLQGNSGQTGYVKVEWTGREPL